MTNEELLKNTLLFTKVDREKFQELLSEIEEVKAPEKTILIREGDLADALYVIKEGALQVFTTGKKGEDIILARLEAGNFFGEQALLTRTPGHRNASIRTLTPCTLLKISHASFLKILAAEDSLKQELEKIGMSQLVTKLRAVESDYDISKYFFDSQEGFETKTFEKDAVIIQQGDPPVLSIIFYRVKSTSSRPTKREKRNSSAPFSITIFSANRAPF